MPKQQTSQYETLSAYDLEVSTSRIEKEIAKYRKINAAVAKQENNDSLTGGVLVAILGLVGYGIVDVVEHGLAKTGLSAMLAAGSGLRILSAYTNPTVINANPISG